MRGFASGTGATGAADAGGDSASGDAPSEEVLAKLAAMGVTLSARQRATAGEWHRTMCPACGGGSEAERSFSIILGRSHAAYRCFRGTCGLEGTIGSASGGDYPGLTGDRSGGGGLEAKAKAKAPAAKAAAPAPPMPFAEAAAACVEAPYTPPSVALCAPNERVLAFFRKRGISDATLSRARVGMQRDVWSPPAGARTDAIAFAYFHRGELVNVKYRGPGKAFWQCKGAKKVLYGVDDLDLANDSEPIVIVEGEVDRLSMVEAGIQVRVRARGRTCECARLSVVRATRAR